MKREIVNRRVVMCDFDGPEKVKDVKYRWKYIAKQLWPGVRFRLHFKVSPSGRGLHFWAVAAEDLIWSNKKEEGLRKVLSYTVLLAQCLMGSDIKRERANLARISAGIEDWNVLFSSRRSEIKDRRKK